MKYTIKSGKHYANFTLDRLFPFCGKKLSGRVKLSLNCLHEGEISGWNKLTGISEIDNHNNSGRLVWMSNGSKIRIAGYVYKNGQRKEKEFALIDVEKWYDFKVEFKDMYWRFSIDDNVIFLPGELKGWKFKQFPYFGGRSTAPFTMNIWIE